MTNQPTSPLVERPLRLTRRSTPQARRALGSGAAGSVLEWFDFALYGATSATVFPLVFFSSEDQATAILLSFATFGVGILARPLGAVVFGYFGDRVGRRAVLLTTFIMMGASSIVIGLLPGYAQIGFAAPMLLVVMRFLQGFALGGEATGAQLLTMEHAPRDRRALYSSLMTMGAPASQVLANLMLVLLSATLTDQAFLSWGWRIPFLLSVLLVLVGIYIRLKVEETPLFKAGVESVAGAPDGPLTVVRAHWRTLLRMILAYAPSVVTFYVITVFGTGYLTKTVGLSNDETFTIIMVSNLLSVGAIVFGGWMADIFGRIRILSIGSLGCLAGAFVFFAVADTANFWLILAVVSIALSFAQIGNAAIAALFAEAFPTHHRYTGSALSTTGSTLVFSAPAPFVAAWLTQSVTPGSTVLVTVIWIVIIVAALVNLALMKEGPSLEGDRQYFGRRIPADAAELLAKDPESEIVDVRSANGRAVMDQQRRPGPDRTSPADPDPSEDAGSDSDAIRNVMGRYVRLIDTGRYAMLGECFTDDVAATFAGASVDPGLPGAISYISNLGRFASCQHLLFPLNVTTSGDTATAHMYGTAVLVSDDGPRAEAVVRGLSYDLRLRRTEAGWRIAVLEQQALWSFRTRATLAPGSAFSGTTTA
ncbi:MFS transporter [Nonomuraea deserti]|uniref:MFS transporter n=1 Tax=Nonomuraea deserti TaxID=1848322 RepID=UPI001405463B|nr:MFS transporter [Nonomuraea deserti]